MKKFLLIFTLLLSTSIFSQVKIGENPQTIDQNSILELESTTKTLVVTRITSAQMSAITPLEGAIAYNTDEDCLFQYNNNTWNSLCVDVMANETVTSITLNNDGTFTYVDEAGSNTIISLNDSDSDNTNELNTAVILNGTNLETTDAGGTITTDLSTLDESAEVATNSTDITALETEQATQNTAITNNETTITDHIAADEDTDATNEIQTVASVDNSVNVTTDANNNIDLSVTPFDDTAIQTQITENANDIDNLEAEQITQNTTIADNTNNITTNATDIATLETEQATQNTAITNNETAIANHITADEDTDATNEIQTVASSDSSVTVTTDVNNNIDLSVTPFDDTAIQTQITENANDIGDLEAEQITQNTAITGNTTNIATNATAFATLETEQATQNTAITNNETTIANHIAADEDTDATNEIQTVASSDSSVTVTTDANNNIDISVTPFDDTAIQTQITENANDIEDLEAEQITQNTVITDNTANTSTNIANIAALETEQTIQNTNIQNNTDAITNHIAVDLDIDPTNELQDISLNGTELTVTNSATSGNLVDLTAQITLPMFANGINSNDEVYWDGSQWVYGTRVATVNGSTPDESGNVNIPIGNVYTGPTTTTNNIGTDEVGGAPQEGDIYVVNSDAPDPAQVGNTYIYDIDSMDWIAIDPFNAALYDPRYVNVSGDTMVGNLDMNGNTVTDLGNPINNSDATPKSYVDSIELIDNNNGTVSLLKPDGTFDVISKASLIDNNNGTYTFNNNDGNPVTIDIAALETTTSIINNGNQTFTYFNEDNVQTTFSIVDNDNDATNEIQTVASADSSVTVTTDADNNIDLSVTPFDDTAIQSQITENANDIDDLEAEQGTQNTAITSNTTNIATNASNIADHITADEDTDATNEIQTVASSDSSVTVTTDADNNIDLSVTPFDDTAIQTQITENANDIDDLEAEQTTQNTAITNNETAIANHIAADGDTDATNEIQTVASTDSSVTVTTDADNNIDLSVTPFDDTAIQTQITENANDIDDLEAEQITQNTAITGNTTNIATNAFNIADHITADEDTDATNEIQTVASSDSSVTVTTDADNNIDLSITPFDDTAIQTQITENANDIDDLETEQSTQNTAIAGNTTNIATNATDIATLETEQATQNTAITNNETAIANHIAADGDTDATNEIQTVASSDSSVTVTTDADNNIDLSVTPFDD
ncbi:hypothetical protein, partial [uncultured Lacinutrix sp.]|uniref:beta strand repeat-containing protein n=1 Tax=uncultured Lacinutrix sp. TaxID=574032 RepID=UPI0026242834